MSGCLAGYAFLVLMETTGAAETEGGAVDFERVSGSREIDLHATDRVDDVGGFGEAEAHQRDQALPAGEDFCIVAIFTEQGERLLDALRSMIRERTRNHPSSPSHAIR